MNANHWELNSQAKLPTGQNLTLFFYFLSGDAVNKIPIYSLAMISNPLVCNVCLFRATVFGEMKPFAVLWFLV